MLKIRIYRSADGAEIWTGYDWGGCQDCGNNYPATADGLAALKLDLKAGEDAGAGDFEAIDDLQMPAPGASTGQLELDGMAEPDHEAERREQQRRELALADADIE